MFRLVRFFLSLVVLAGFVAFGLIVKLGERTLFGHIANIVGSKESQELVRGTKEAAQPIVERLRGPGPTTSARADASATDARAAAPAAPPSERLTDEDRARLRKLLDGEKKR